MRETKFINQNKEKWKEFEKTMDGGYRNPEKLLHLFVQILDDLSFSRTFYPNRSVRVYLNGLAQQIFFAIYKNRKSRVSRFFSFWTEELPQMVFQARKELLLSFLIFSLSILIGALSTAMDSEFPTLILGERYVDMTLENIEKNDPMAVYKSKGKFGDSIGITVNNLYVAFLAYALGVFYFGTIIILIKNGIMVGVFQYFFIERDLFWESFLTIWIHGTLEISAIIIAGAAGLTMGKGLIFPGTYRRLQAFQLSARRGIKVMIGIAPIFIIAGFIEGYLTRYTEAPDLLRGFFIFACFLFVVLYYVVFPYIKAQVGFTTDMQERHIPPDKEEQINYKEIKGTAQIFINIFQFYRTHRVKIGITALIAAIIYCVFIFLTAGQSASQLFFFPDYLFGRANSIGQFIYSSRNWLIPIISIISLSILSWMRSESSPIRATSSRISIIVDSLKIILAVVVIHLLFMTTSWNTLGLPVFFGFGLYNLVLLLFALPFLLMWMFIMFFENRNPFSAIQKSIALVRQKFSIVFGLYLALVSICTIFLLIIDTFLLTFLLEVVYWVVQLEEAKMLQFDAVFLAFVTLFILYLVLSLIIIGAGLLYHSSIEIMEAHDLHEKIQTIGISQKIKGLEREAQV